MTEESSPISFLVFPQSFFEREDRSQIGQSLARTMMHEVAPPAAHRPRPAAKNKAF